MLEIKVEVCGTGSSVGKVIAVCKDLSSDANTHVKRSVWWCVPITPALEVWGGTRRSEGLISQPSSLK